VARTKPKVRRGADEEGEAHDGSSRDPTRVALQETADEITRARRAGEHGLMGQVAAQVRRERFDGRVTLSAILVHGPRDDPVEVTAQLPPQGHRIGAAEARNLRASLAKRRESCARAGHVRLAQRVRQRIVGHFCEVDRQRARQQLV
jgi:hypothetical protein